MVTHALVNLPDTDMALPMVMQCAKIVLAHVNVHSVNAMLNSLVNTLVKPEFLMRNITCSGVQTMVVPCGIQPMTMPPVHVVAVESMIHNVVPQKTELVPPFSIMPLQKPAAPMAVSSLTQANVKFTNGIPVGNLPKKSPSSPRYITRNLKIRNMKLHIRIICKMNVNRFNTMYTKLCISNKKTFAIKFSRRKIAN